jgi:DNA-binding response OmpR family regulator
MALDVEGTAPGRSGVVPARVLVVGADRRLAAFARAALATGVYQLEAAPDVASAIDAVFAARPDLVLILGAPAAEEAAALCRELHAVDDLPTIILAADADTGTRVRGLTCADDYVVLPVAPAELEARVAAVLRRTRPCREPSAPVFDDGHLRVDLRLRVVTVGGGPVDLTPTEYRLLALLVSHAGMVFTHDQLLARVWGSAFTGDTHLLRLHVANLRRKIEPGGAPRYIRTMRGVGYAFRPESAAAVEGADAGEGMASTPTDDTPTLRGEVP